MDENENLGDWVFETHRCECGWAGDEGELVDEAGYTYHEFEEMATQNDLKSPPKFQFCPSCYGEPKEILE